MPETTNPIAPPQKTSTQTTANSTTASKNTPSIEQKLGEIKVGGGDRGHVSYRVKLGGSSENPSKDGDTALIFDSSKGQILGTPWVKSSRHEYSCCEFIIQDPDSDILKKLRVMQEVEVEIGIPDVITMNKFVGVIWKLGRRYPSGTYVFGKEKAALASTNNVPSIQETTTGQDDTTTPADLLNLQGDLGILNTETDLLKLIQSTSKINADGQIRVKPASEMSRALSVQGETAKYIDKSNFTIAKEATLNLNGNSLTQSLKDAAQTGDAVDTRGNTTSVVSPGNEPESGVILNFANRNIFSGNPRITRPMAAENSSAYGIWDVRGWDTRTASAIGATAVVSPPDTQHPTGVISVPDWKDIKLSDPIYAGTPYTWKDAVFRDGELRVPKSKEHIENIISICQVITDLTNKLGKGKWTITSWYRLKVVKATKSQHLVGRAVDFYIPGINFRAYYEELNRTWLGGLAWGGKSGTFIHIDNRPNGRLTDRWNY